MALLSANELQEQAELCYSRGTYYVLLLNNLSATYDASTTYADITGDEVTSGLGGYSRLSYTYAAGDFTDSAYGVAVGNKLATFVHDGSSDVVEFTHAAIVRLVGSDYEVVGIEALGDKAVLSEGNSAKININIYHRN